jgi:Kef-type K+ transport system membrane component KefB
MTNSNKPPFVLRLNLLFLAFYFVGFGCSFAIGTQFDYWGIAWLIMVLGSSPIIWLNSRKALRIKDKLGI